MPVASHETVASPQSEQQTDTSVLSLSGIDGLRQQQHDLLYETLDNRNAYTTDEVEAIQDEVMDQYEGQCIEYLAARGIDENHPKFTEYYSIVRSSSYDRMSDQEWYAGTQKADGTLAPSGMDKLREAQERLGQEDAGVAERVEAGTPVIPDNLGDHGPNDRPGDGSIDTDPESEGSHVLVEYPENAEFNNLGEKRAALATLAAKRQGKLFGKGGNQYDEAHEEYSAAVVGAGRNLETLRNTDNPARTQEEKNRDVITYILEEQRRLRTETVENLRGTKVGKFIELMNRGGKGARFFKGTLLGVGVGVLGSALIATGVGLAAGVATAGVMGTRFARGFAAADAQNGRGMPLLADETAGSSLDGRAAASDFTIEEGHEEAMNSFEYDTKQEQKKRRRAAAAGMGGIVLGSLVGEGITLAARGADFTPPGWPWTTPETDIDRPGDGSNGSGGEGGAGNGDGAGEQPGDATTPDSTPDGREYTFGPESQDIHTGEGWYETFQEMGIPADQRHELLHAVGPELQRMGIAYPMGDGSWGISHPGDMPDEALRVIADAARQHGIVTNSTYVFDA